MLVKLAPHTTWTEPNGCINTIKQHDIHNKLSSLTMHGDMDPSISIDMSLNIC